MFGVRKLHIKMEIMRNHRIKSKKQTNTKENKKASKQKKKVEERTLLERFQTSNRRNMSDHDKKRRSGI